MKKCDVLRGIRAGVIAWGAILLLAALNKASQAWGAVWR